MIDINRVYTTVQAILNIEQRGQLTGSDFNKMANLSQLDLFNKLFYDEPYFSVHPKGGMNSEIVRNITEMQDVFVEEIEIQRTSDTERFDLPEDLYRLDAVYYDNAEQLQVDAGGDPTQIRSFRQDYIKVEKLSHRDYSYITRSPLTTPSRRFPKYLRFQGTPNSSIEVLPSKDIVGGDKAITLISIDYVRHPAEPEWVGMIVFDGSLLYDSVNSVHFGLHPAMENDLIHRILFYAGVSIREENIATLIQGLAQRDEQVEKS